MLSLASKLLFGIAAVTLATAVGFGITVTEQSGTALLFSVAVAATVAGLVLARIPDLSAEDGAGGSPTTEPSGPTSWPLIVAVAAGVLAAGVATGPVLLVAGTLAVVGALVGWFGHSWAQHPSWTEHHASRVGDRGLTPVFLPLGVLALIAVIVIAFSRVLLALPKEGSTFVALIAAVLILVACSVVAAKPRMASSAMSALVTVAGVAVVAAGVAGAMAGEREFHPAGAEHAAEGAKDGAKADGHGGEDKAAGKGGAGSTIEIEADNLAFDTKEITLKADAKVTVRFRNAEPLPHNVAIYDGSKALFKGDVVSGPIEQVYETPELHAGTYEFRCDVHPSMKGKVVVE